MSLQLPTVTVDDLRDFHARHFPHASAPEHILHGVEEAPVEEHYEEDASLGYYEDGTPRTLTDEQIAMFRHSEIQAIIRKRRHLRDNGDNGSEEGEAVESVVEEVAETDSAASLSTPTVVPDLGKVASGRVEKPKTQQWATSSAGTKRRNKRNRDRYRAKKETIKREQTRKSNREDDESDEWDPWHQANGPDVQKDETIDLDY
ncbi:hypothetical protein G6514_005583 [Epicoccum nigrum]|nr:hypothetical protein G6514_005583 [Epicoccum nigrum]